MRDEERSTRELPAEGTGTSGPSEARRMADGIDGIPEQARPHPEDDSTGAVLPGGGRLDQGGAVRSAPPGGGDHRIPCPQGVLPLARSREWRRRRGLGEGRRAGR
ncbi:hypothetical protein GCM10011428_24260 [Streptomyces violaceus]